MFSGDPAGGWHANYRPVFSSGVGGGLISLQKACRSPPLHACQLPFRDPVLGGLGAPSPLPTESSEVLYQGTGRVEPPEG